MVYRRQAQRSLHGPQSQPRAPVRGAVARASTHSSHRRAPFKRASVAPAFLRPPLCLPVPVRRRVMHLDMHLDPPCHARALDCEAMLQPNPRFLTPWRASAVRTQPRTWRGWRGALPKRLHKPSSSTNQLFETSSTNQPFERQLPHRPRRRRRPFARCLLRLHPGRHLRCRRQRPSASHILPRFLQAPAQGALTFVEGPEDEQAPRAPLVDRALPETPAQRNLAMGSRLNQTPRSAFHS
jgi:hypothetical protein